MTPPTPSAPNQPPAVPGDRHRLRFCPDCGTAADGRDTCSTCARTLLFPVGLVASLAEAVAVGTAGRLGRLHRRVRESRRRYVVVRVVAAAGLFAVVAGTSFGAGAALSSGGDDHDGTTVTAEHHDGGQNGRDDHGN